MQHQIVVLNADARFADVRIDLCRVRSKDVDHDAATLADKVGFVLKTQITDDETGRGVVRLA
ncbi:hypothetical protein D3C78_1766760 [compost metagenome]